MNKPASPLPKGPGIAIAKRLLMDKLQAGTSRLPFDARRCRQHPTWKNMALNEVWAAPICRIAALINGNDLKHSDAAIRERRSQLIEIGWPITFANRLEHLNRDDAVIAPLNVPVIKQAQIGASVLDFAGEARLGVGKLFGR